jgi:ABC-type nitrate/sulfonate/bicarbonate transport system ATPase subunit
VGHPKIAICDLSVAFPGRGPDRRIDALQNVSLQVEDGEFVCLLGPSGCGKTTLLNCIAGFVEPTAGEILVNGLPVMGPGPERGMVFQEYGLFPWFTVEQNIQYGPKVRGGTKAELKAISDRYIRLVNLQGFERLYPRELSGGMKQRVGIARALANQPDVLLLDEPFGALDAQTRERLQSELLKIWQTEQCTCVFVTHSITEAVFLGDRVIVMTARPGRIKNEIAVRLPRARSRTSEAFVAMYREVDGILREEIDLAFETAEECLGD